ncbi:IS3 family transposase [Wohlfahrtiimonas chitiniclastica]|uniref:IS3 family transposase n=2 Tax=Wohlfahrtiimonas chitiniclastica TaxID=400946 RepID=UPI0012E816B1|nr:IS3 family transposase [Wohlfahrtiimonas chitiniclastica]
MTKREKYTAEFRAQAVKKVEEHNGNISLTSRELGLPMQTLFNWCNKANKGQLIGTEQYAPDIMAILEENKQLKRALRIAEEEREIPKKGHSILRKKQLEKYAFVQNNSKRFSINRMCKVFDVHVSGYYQWINKKISIQSTHRNRCELIVKAAHQAKNGLYGHERLHQYLLVQGYSISLYMVRTIREKLGIRCTKHCRYKQTTQSKHNKPIYTNLLGQYFEYSQPNQAWCSDITYIWTAEGWLYVAGIKDLFTHEIVGYAIDKHMTSQLVCDALNMAIRNQKPSKGLIVHSDRGSQYCSKAYRSIIQRHKFLGSMSRKGNCYDNAPIESFWGTLKNELVYHKDYKTRGEAKADITQYIELEYNQTRIQKGLGWMSPRQLANLYYERHAA